MAFTVRDFRDLVELLEQHPEWRAELRRLVLTEELLTLPQLIRDLVDAQQHTEQRLERLEVTVQALAEAQRQKWKWHGGSVQAMWSVPCVVPHSWPKRVCKPDPWSQASVLRTKRQN